MVRPKRLDYPRGGVWMKSSRFRPGSALGRGLAGFFFSGFAAFLLPMSTVYRL
jgi:hypothetical protein